MALLVNIRLAKNLLGANALAYLAVADAVPDVDGEKCFIGVIPGCLLGAEAGSAAGRAAGDDVIKTFHFVADAPDKIS